MTVQPECNDHYWHYDPKDTVLPLNRICLICCKKQQKDWRDIE